MTTKLATGGGISWLLAVPVSLPAAKLRGQQKMSIIYLTKTENGWRSMTRSEKNGNQKQNVSSTGVVKYYSCSSLLQYNSRTRVLTVALVISIANTKCEQVTAVGIGDFFAF